MDKRFIRGISFVLCVDGRLMLIFLKMVLKCVIIKWRNKNFVKILFIFFKSFVLIVDISCYLEVKLYCYRIYLKGILKKIYYFYM